MTNGLEIHACTNAELRCASELAAEIWREHYTPLIGSNQVEYMLEKFQSADAMRRQVDEQNYHYFLAVKDNHPAGYCALKPESNGSLFLSKFYVEKSRRGHGIGKAMLEHALAQLHPAAGTRLWLTVNKHNDGSIAAYKKLGFSIAGEVATDIGNGFSMDDFVMEKQL